MGDRPMDEDTLRMEADTPMTGVVLIFTQGPWGSGDDAARAAKRLAEKAGMNISPPKTGGGIMRFSLSGDGKSDMDYLRIVDMMFSSFPEYMPQMIPITEADDGE